MNQTIAKQVMDALEKAEKISQARPALPKELLPSYLRLLDKTYQLSLEGKVCASDIAKAMHQTKPSITRSFIALEELGCIQKQTSTEDRRVTYISLTEKGIEIYRHYVETYYKKLASRLKKYDMKDISSMIEFVDRLYTDLTEDPIVVEEKEDVK